MSALTERDLKRIENRIRDLQAGHPWAAGPRDIVAEQEALQLIEMLRAQAAEIAALAGKVELGHRMWKLADDRAAAAEAERDEAQREAVKRAAKQVPRDAGG